ncbi:MAG: DUF3570 domain-containing protein [Burkholderiales bacterium]|nr:DUF3570 domain-containing protein [Burkholderiales bacterium]MDE1926144.1 DUF3570 domain-containing protein [Burkholderiales bacterium]MDE2159755.1 DUF3570 domain-containing protein [Burkholderiales bacterium]MDE2502932.1 DUF3570 domain-containing protein [Burkholderiales bacterium]
MAATEERARGALLGSIVLAACALPGVLPGAAWAEDAPTDGLLSIKMTQYQDSQTGLYGGNTNAVVAGAGGGLDTRRILARGSGLATISSASSGGGGGGGGGGPSNTIDRMRILTPSVYALVPINRHWAANGALTVDDVSGASPRYYSDMRSAAQIVDRRVAEDAKLHYYGARQGYSLGLAHSSEHDFLSDAISADATLASDNQDTTWNAGLALTQDVINPVTHIVRDQKRHTVELQLGVTQALDATDLVQAEWTTTRDSGYLNDPYKFDDVRPNRRTANVLQLHWNHWTGDSALKFGYRYYRDSYGVQAHTVDLAWVMPVLEHVDVTPALRYYTQTAASFYADPPAVHYPNPVGTPTYFSADQRLAAFGALSWSLKIAWRMSPAWTVDGKVELYHQRSNWALGSGSPQINPFDATTVQLGLSRVF